MTEELEQFELPPDWTAEPLNRVFRFTKKPKTIRYSDFESIPFVPMELIPQGGRTATPFVLRKPEAISSGTYFERGDVLLAKITPSFENGKQGIASEIPADFGVASTEAIPIQAIPGTSNKHFLFYYLLKADVRTAIARRMEGSTGRQRVPESVVANWLLPLPPLPEQKRVAAVLWKIQQAIEVEAELARNTCDLKKTMMRQLFTAGMRREPQKETEIGLMPESWSVVALETLARIGNGSTPKRTNPAYWTKGTIPWLTSGKIHEGIISSADQFVTDTAVQECHLPLVRAGSVLVAITGQGKTLGNAAIVTFDTCISQHLACFQFTKADVVPAFIMMFLQSRYDELHRAGQAGGSTKGALTCGFLRNYRVPLPNQDEQKEIADILDTLERKIGVHEAKQRAWQDLFKTMLQKLMTAQIRVNDLDIDIREIEA